MGPRAAPGPGRGRPAAPGLRLTVARVPAAGHGRSRGPRGGDKPGASGRRIDPARLVAFDVLRGVRERAAYANLLLPALLRERGLTGRDAALATELSYGTLRGQGTYDAVIAACSARGLNQIDPPVRDVLRLGAHQLLATRIGAHAAVATSVDLAREVSGPGAAGFVNAVLRRVATRDLEAWITAIAPDRAADPGGHLAVRYSHPRWIVAAFSESLGDGGAAGPAPAQAEAALPQTEAAPAQTEAALPQTEAAPAQTEAAPAQTEAAPAQTEAAPAQTEAAPAQTEAAPAQTEAAPAQTEAAPAQTEAAPAQTEA